MDELKPCPVSPTQANEASIALLEIMEDGVASRQKALSTAYKALYWIANDRRAAPENKPITVLRCQNCINSEPFNGQLICSRYGGIWEENDGCTQGSRKPEGSEKV